MKMSEKSWYLKVCDLNYWNNWANYSCWIFSIHWLTKYAWIFS
jgi:hypothetical protein